MSQLGFWTLSESALDRNYLERVTPTNAGLQGYLAHKKHQPPEDHHRSLGVGLR